MKSNFGLNQTPTRSSRLDFTLNYVICYWVAPETSDARRKSLVRYFDLQRHTKSNFGAEQIIVTNLDYPGAIPFVEPPGFKREHALFAVYFGLGQLIDEGLSLPVVLHDHDVFLRAPVKAVDDAIQCIGRSPGGSFSEQLLVFPELSKNALKDYITHLKTFEFCTGQRLDHGADVRHDGMFSSEYTLANTKPSPFDGIPIEASIELRDLVSFDIGAHHSLDAAYCECNTISDNAQAVHGHLNKGPATDALLKWLTQ